MLVLTCLIISLLHAPPTSLSGAAARHLVVEGALEDVLFAYRITGHYRFPRETDRLAILLTTPIDTPRLSATWWFASLRIPAIVNTHSGDRDRSEATLSGRFSGSPPRSVGGELSSS
jgi:hypothetical protein